VKLPKTFLAINLSDAFSFQERSQPGDSDGLEIKSIESTSQDDGTALLAPDGLAKAQTGHE
jgi:hypothetical protein